MPLPSLLLAVFSFQLLSKKASEKLTLMPSILFLFSSFVKKILLSLHHPYRLTVLHGKELDGRSF